MLQCVTHVRMFSHTSARKMSVCHKANRETRNSKTNNRRLVTPRFTIYNDEQAATPNVVSHFYVGSVFTGN